MQQAQPIQVGDRVQVCRPLINLPEGSTGVVQSIFHTVDRYDVLFDERHVLYVLYRHEFALISPERAREVGR